MSTLQKIKAILSSRTMMGALMIFIVSIFPRFAGLTTADELTHFFDQLFEVVGFALVLVGRVKAQGPLFETAKTDTPQKH